MDDKFFVGFLAGGLAYAIGDAVMETFRGSKLCRKIFDYFDKIEIDKKWK